MGTEALDIFGLEYGIPLSTGGTMRLADGLPDELDCAGLDFVQMTPSVCDVMLVTWIRPPSRDENCCRVSSGSVFTPETSSSRSKDKIA